MKLQLIYDLEVLPDIFTATFQEINSDKLYTFVISDYKDERKELFKFLSTIDKLVGYNCLNYDSQILEFMYKNPSCSHVDIRAYSDTIINSDEFPEVPEWKLKIPHIDLYKIHHFDNKNRRTSLKWVEYMMDLENIEDMPDNISLTPREREASVLEYNLNDVVATKALLMKTLSMINLRKNLSSKYRLNLINASDSRIGSEMLLDLYCNKTSKNKKEVRKLRTFRNFINIEKLIFPYIVFKSKEFNELLNKFKSKVVTSTKGELNFSVLYKGFKFDYGSGGLHGSLVNAIAEDDDDNVLIDSDVGSLYPSIACMNGMYPEHLGKEFSEVYKNDIVDIRMVEKKKGDLGDMDIIAAYKSASNSAYGKSNDKHSWLYDPKYTLETTINGQLMLTMLLEDVMNIEGLKLIQVNTDGITSKLPKDKVKEYYKKCSEWEKITKLNLEHAEYSKMIIQDVNY